MTTIFVQIASYRDPQLLPTLRDCITKAKWPNRLRFGICWQHGSDESLEEFAKDKRFRIVDVPFALSKGACWARSEIQKLYKDETYTLQLDSHHRFVQDWDDKCIKAVKKLQKIGHNKPLLTSYIPSYDPDKDPEARVQYPWKMNFDRFTPEGIVFFLPGEIPDWAKYKGVPIPARFFSAHFVFTLGSWIKEVPYDPNYYFHGEEISLAVRSYTHGYDLFHPTEVIAWHEYTRKGRTKQWDDDKGWGERNNICHIRNRKLFGMDGEKQDIDFGVYGFGTERTLHDYEKYAGISFSQRGIQQHTKEYNNPPNPPVEDWDKSLQSIFRHCIDIQFSQLPEQDYDFICIAFHDKEGKELYRKDILPDELQMMRQDKDGYIKCWREFYYKGVPASWSCWPHSTSKGWCPRFEGKLLP